MTAKKLLRVVTLAVTAMICLAISTIAFADKGDRYKIDEEGNWFPLGGVNQYEGIEVQTREETLLLEQNLIANGYLLCSTDDMMISEAEFEALTNYHKSFWFSKYMDKESYAWSKCRVYVFKPSFTDFIEQTEDGWVNNYTYREICESAVVIDYLIWDNKDKVGTISDAYNDNISDELAGYMEIRSPVDCEIKFWHSDTNRYYVFYISEDIPFKVKVIQGFYHIVEINSLSINNNVNDAGEDTLPYNNQILIYDHCTFDNPYIIDLYDLCNKYNIKSIDISGKPDLSIDQNQNIPDITTESVNIDEESTIVQDKDKDNTKSEGFSWMKLILWIILGVAIIGVIIYEITEMKRKESDDDNSDDD